VEQSATIKAKDLSIAERRWIGTVLHVDLREDDEFTVTLHRPVIRVPTAEQRAEAREGLQEFFARIDERMKDVPEAEVDAAIEEAFEHVRSQKR
jgi:hypothetical protein